MQLWSIKNQYHAQFIFEKSLLQKHDIHVARQICVLSAACSRNKMLQIKLENVAFSGEIHDDFQMIHDLYNHIVKLWKYSVVKMSL